MDQPPHPADPAAPSPASGAAPAPRPGDAPAWLALDKAEPARAEKLFAALAPEERLRTVLAAPLTQRERLLTLAPDTAHLVRQLAPDEFFRTMAALGPEEGAGVLVHATPSQLGHLLDLAGWAGEKFAPRRYLAWLPALVEAGPGPLNRWLKTVDLEVLVLLLASLVRVHKYVASQDEQEPPDDLPAFTLDGIYFLEFGEESDRDLVVQLLVHLKSELPELYGEALEALLWEPPSLLGEDALRLRAGRLADLGFPDREEALTLWAKPKPGEDAWQEVPLKSGLGWPPAPVPRSDQLLGLLPPDLALPSLAAELDPATRDALLMEVAHLANCGVVALGVDPLDQVAVTRAAREGLGLANLGLSLLAGGDVAAARQIVARLPLAALARQGAQALRELNRRAHQLASRGWLHGIPTGLYLLDPPLDRVVAGLLHPRPRFHDPRLEGGREYRPFLSPADLEEAGHKLALAEFAGRLFFELLGISREELGELLAARVWPEDPREIKLSTVLGTWLARRALGLAGLAPLGPEQLVPAVAALKAGLAGPLAGELHQSLKAVADPGQAALAGKLLREELGRLGEELAGLDPAGGLDPRFLGGLVVARE